MANVGQCKACWSGVSDEAASCPKCGQPQPYLRLPEVGSRHHGRFESLFSVGERSQGWWVVLSTGIRGSLWSDSVLDFREGDSVTVRVRSTHRMTGSVDLDRL